MRSGKLAPSRVRTHYETCLLKQQVIDTPRSWFMVDEGGVDIANQRNGQKATGDIRLTHAEVRRFVRWYFRQQRISAATVKRVGAMFRRRQRRLTLRRKPATVPGKVVGGA